MGAVRSKIIPINYARSINKMSILIGEDIEGDTIETLEAWYKHPYKYEIMRDAMSFKEHLRSQSRISYLGKLLGITRFEIGLIEGVRTPIILSDCDCMERLICNFEKGVDGKFNYPRAGLPPDLIGTELGHTILNELKNTSFSEDYIFCHNALYYKSFVLKDNKLIGIRNWQYAGFYPPEFEEVTYKYLEFFNFEDFHAMTKRKLRSNK
ncbi:hypothetical protein BGW37DRAFT_181628 [Umbelopsis sp. PMI_123]|nr:hypothetical protein BGW37DRAFT_181628 [Umbelopsis sp. PMI_123]